MWEADIGGRWLGWSIEGHLDIFKVTNRRIRL